MLKKKPIIIKKIKKKKPIIIKKVKKKDIIGYENLYEIYDDGRVYSKKRKIFMKPVINSKGYYKVNLRKDNKGTTYQIHRLIAIHFIPNPHNKSQVDHIDRNRLNNSIKNLQWATHQENGCNRTVRSNKKKGKYVGVDWIESINKWITYVVINGKQKHIGYYDDEEVALEERKKYIQTNLPERYSFYYP